MLYTRSYKSSRTKHSTRTANTISFTSKAATAIEVKNHMLHARSYKSSRTKHSTRTANTIRFTSRTTHVIFKLNQTFPKNHNFTQENFKLGMEINVKRCRGGLQQRLDEEQRQRTRSSKLANHLLTQYACGKMSVQEVQALAALAVEDLKEGNSTVVFTDLIQLSKLGSSDQHKQNMSRDMEKYIESINSLPKPTMVDLPNKNGQELTGLMLPHQSFSFLYEKYRTVFNKLFMPCGTQQIQDFWRQCSGAACLQGQPGILIVPKPFRLASTGTKYQLLDGVSAGSRWLS